jgi:hypothetical protein
MADQIDVDDHSRKLGGSSARKRIQCPASYRLEEPYPDDPGNQYTAEGTVLHKVVETCIREDLDATEIAGKVYRDDETGLEFEMDDERVVLVAECLKHVDALCPEGDDVEIYLEIKAPFPLIPGSFGTCDLCVINHTKKLVSWTDWKFGGGVPVKAIYEDAEGNGVINEQLLFYNCAGINGLGAKIPRDYKHDLHVFQPRMLPEGHTSALDVDDEERKAFVEAAVNATMPTAINAPPVKGDWCRWCKAKLTCPEFTGPLLDLVALAPKVPERKTEKAKNGKAVKTKALAAPPPNDYAEVLSAGLQLASIVEDLIGELKAQAHTFLEQGGKIKGFKLVDKRATRSWVDDEKTPAALIKLGLPQDAIFDTVLVSPTEAEKRLKARGKDLTMQPESQPGLVKKVSSGTTMAPDDDARPPAGTDAAELMSRFAKATGLN